MSVAPDVLSEVEAVSVANVVLGLDEDGVRDALD